MALHQSASAVDMMKKGISLNAGKEITITEDENNFTVALPLLQIT